MSDVEVTPGTASASGERKITVFDLDQLPHDQQDLDLLNRIYQQKRIDAQVNFYQSRIKENNKNADFTFAAGALVMTISSLVATISASTQDPFLKPFLTVMSAMLPAFAALMASFRQLYGWERQASIYRDALLGLERVRLLAPDNDRVSAADLRQVYPQLVTSSEKVFTGEVSQWGQFVVSTEAKESKGDETLQNLFNDLQLTDDQRAAVQSILSAGKKTDVNVTTNVVKSTDVTVQTTLPSGSDSNPVVTQVSATQKSASTASLTTAQPTTSLPFDESQLDKAALAAAASSEVSSGDTETPPVEETTPSEGDADADKSVG